MKNLEMLISQQEGQFLEFKSSDGRYLLRINDQNMPFPAEDIQKLKEGKRSALYERSIMYGAKLDDLDEEWIKKVKDTTIEGCLPCVIDETYRLIQSHIKERKILYDLFFHESMEYPTFAWQETIVKVKVWEQ